MQAFRWGSFGARWRRLVLGALFMAGVGSAAAKVTALVGGQLIDGWGGAPVPHSVILIEGERISAVGTVDSLVVPAGAEIIDTRGMSLLPGLWDCHVHTALLGHADYAHWHGTYQPRFASEIMPAAARQLLQAGVTSAMDLGAPLADSIAVRDNIAAGKIPGPTLYVSGPFIQHAAPKGREHYRWGVSGAADARAKVGQLADAGVNVIKLIDQDQMTAAEVEAVIDEAHRRGLPVIAHAHRPEEIRRGLKYGVDRFEHTGLSTAPGYPEDVLTALKERTADMSRGLLFWCPTVEGFLNYEDNITNQLHIEDPAWEVEIPADIAADIRASLARPGWLPYYQITPVRSKTSATKIAQLMEAGVMPLIGTDSGIPMKFHNQSTWRELDAWVNRLGIDPMTAIRAATYWPAVSMKVDADYGTVSPGKYADIIAVKGDVMRYIDLLQRVDIVVKHGRRVK
ncbi:amidohydrolase family protein [Synoicihabitans lomoniglobus]|uniref:Amidohydrolase family protein n=1 Tax=Synoicihabitans lomoniglobus TaxID=2909285 RepID=A0AAF0CMG1_9BACT|nr:amidohydrolase family protein [Opitutaceae bacterium LMO-M01]